MVGKANLALGLLASFLTISAVLADNTVIGTYKAGPGNAEASAPKESGPADPGKIPEATETSQTSDGNGTSAKGDATPISSKGTDSSNTSDNAAKGDATPINSKGTDSSDISDNAELAKRINAILTNNPEIIVGALQKFNQNQQRAQQEKLEASLMKYKNDISKESNAVVLGKKDAEIKLVVFLDPNCPHCRPFSQALTKVGSDYPNVAIFVRHWAILGPDSEDVSRALWAIKQQGQDKFIAASKAIASSDERYTYAKLLAWVTDYKLDVPKFKTDYESQAGKDVIDETKKLAMDIGLEGTPTSLLVSKKGIRLVTPTDEKSLQSILKGAGKDGAKSDNA